MLLFLGCDDDSPTGPSDLCGVSGGDYILYENGYHCGDIQVLQDIIDANPCLEGQNPLEIDSQIAVWILSTSGTRRLFVLQMDSNNNCELISIPESIGDLTSLYTLNIAGNQVTSIPESIGNLINLVGLHLSNNQLTSLPESICNLHNNILCEVHDGGGCIIDVENNNLCEEYHYDCIDDWGTQDQSNCCEGENADGETVPNWKTCPE